MWMVESVSVTAGRRAASVDRDELKCERLHEGSTTANISPCSRCSPVY